MLKFKLVFIGDQAVGKSSIITRFIKDQFDPTHNPTVGIDFVSKNINISGTTVRLQLWDTAGQ
jgi:small GTP-binding protein